MVPGNLFLTDPIIRSRGYGAEEVKSTLFSTRIREDWHPPKEVGRRNWDRARGEGCPKHPGLRGEGWIIVPLIPSWAPSSPPFFMRMVWK